MWYCQRCDIVLKRLPEFFCEGQQILTVDRLETL